MNNKLINSHPFEPVYDKNSRILILGSFPSVKSRENLFYYGNPQNRFWRVMSEIYNDDLPDTNEEKKRFLLKHNVALWDVVKSCEIKASSDSSIKNVKPNDINIIVSASKIDAVFANGKTAQILYEKYIKSKTGKEIILLPSTSPANAAYSKERLVECWKDKIKEYIKG